MEPSPTTESGQMSPCKLLLHYPDLQHYYALHHYNSRRKYWKPLLPESTSFCFIIGLDHRTMRYACPSFKPEATDHHITENELKAFLRKLTRKAEPELDSLRSGRSLMRFFLFLIPALLLTGLALIIYGINERIIGYSEVDGVEIVKASYALIVGFVLCIIALVGGVLIFSFCLALLIGNSQELLTEKIVDHIMEENLRWKKRGIQWIVGPRGWWIEMWLEYMLPNGSDNLGVTPESTADPHYGSFDNSSTMLTMPNSGTKLA